MFLLMCHRSERSEVKRSRESMGVFMDCHVANAPRNDEGGWIVFPLTLHPPPPGGRDA
ncbi:MAG: hypothetical protein NC218_11670 [Acetobacter sp.]|nr:hypothetical protein [Acetobacter sp.]